MDNKQLLHRKSVLFADSLSGYTQARNNFFNEVNELWCSGKEDKAVSWVKDMYIDAQSFLTEWKLDRWLDKEEKAGLISECEAFLKSHNADEALSEANDEVADIKSCRLAEVSRMTLAGKMNVYWGHDKCDEIDYSLRRGASFTTSNPGKVNTYRKQFPNEWAKMLAEAKNEYEIKNETELLSVMTMKTVAMMARHTQPVCEATDGQYGFSSIQVSPKNWNDAEAMEREIVFWYEAFKKELGTETPNITFKVPATPAAVIAAAKVRKKYARLRVCATSNFSTRQHMEFYKALENRDPAALLVIVDVHLRTYSKPEFEAMGVDDPEKYCKLLVSMVYRRCYELLKQNGLNIQINGAGIRDAEGVRNNFTTDMSLPVTLTIMPEVVKDFNEHPQALTDAMHDKVSEADMEILNRSKIFRQAYYAEEFPWDDIRSFPPYCLMMDKFEEAYDENLASLKEAMKG